MIRGDIYLHPSLTEAFGTVIVEAASCGLYVVATAVGGVPEVLPPHMTVFAKPEEDG
jgi:phosphatidylinositol N-acetylglucosaminyltransferase subunit A